MTFQNFYSSKKKKLDQGGKKKKKKIINPFRGHASLSVLDIRAILQANSTDIRSSASVNPPFPLSAILSSLGCHTSPSLPLPFVSRQRVTNSLDR